ncbi:hypothetical protein [uncultured Ruegeria sp.]|uniref:hypothetical protein n=1 Tax=uncultured Ruegeria sp. TaxID=259304 RepID=UPI00260BB591|nr:hypothetical protein [uncultured Ruegeria sp.]
MVLKMRDRVETLCVQAMRRCFGTFMQNPDIYLKTFDFKRAGSLGSPANFTFRALKNELLSTCSQVLERIFLATASSERSQGMRPVFLEVERNAGSVAVRMAKPGKGV